MSLYILFKLRFFVEFWIYSLQRWQNIWERVKFQLFEIPSSVSGLAVVVDIPPGEFHLFLFL